MRQCQPCGFSESEITYGWTNSINLDTSLLTDEHLHRTNQPGMAFLREHVFTFMQGNAGDRLAHFGAPDDRTVHIGTHLDIY